MYGWAREKAATQGHQGASLIPPLPTGRTVELLDLVSSEQARMKTLDRPSIVQVRRGKHTNPHISLYRNGAVSEICPPDQDVDHDWVALAAKLLSFTEYLDHLILVVP